MSISSYANSHTDFAGHAREYRGLLIRIWGAGVEGRQLNQYQWKVESAPLESRHSFYEFNDAYYDATAKIDKWLAQFEKNAA